MTKAEIIEAINSTIVTNGQKGITAESLANLLIEMASATPEGGSGNGQMVIYIPATEKDDGMDIPLTPEQQSNNAKVYAHCLECHNNNTPLPLIMVDVSSIYSVLMGTEASSTAVASMSIFTLGEAEAVGGSITGLAIMSPDMGAPICILEDGSVTLMEA